MKIDGILDDLENDLNVLLGQIDWSELTLKDFTSMRILHRDMKKQLNLLRKELLEEKISDVGNWG